MNDGYDTLLRDLLPIGDYYVIRDVLYDLLTYPKASYTLSSESIKVYSNKVVSCTDPLPSSYHRTRTYSPYTAPETITDQICDEKSFVWSIGILCIEMAYGHTPYQSYLPIQTVLSITQDRVDLSFLQTPKSFKKMVQLCLRKNRSKRPTIDQLLNHKFFEKYNKEGKSKNKYKCHQNWRSFKNMSRPGIKSR